MATAAFLIGFGLVFMLDASWWRLTMSDMFWQVRKIAGSTGSSELLPILLLTDLPWLTIGLLVPLAGWHARIASRPWFVVGSASASVLVFGWLGMILSWG